MIRLWHEIILPIARAANARTLLEIGAESGDSTKTLLNYVQRHDGQLHCIDPNPIFDPESLQDDYPGRLHYYRDLSLNALPGIPQVDAALIDGDHNWYTVYNELKQLERTHQRDQPRYQPVLIFHDINWPYGRRDLYYDPDTIPKEYSHPHEQQGILPEHPELVKNNGLNPHLHNAVLEGGARNGVLTGIEDYLAETPLNYRFIKLPIYHGLGIAITEERLQSNHGLRKAVDKLELSDKATELLGLCEHMRSVEEVLLQVTARKLHAAEKRNEELEKEFRQIREKRNV